MTFKKLTDNPSGKCASLFQEKERLAGRSRECLKQGHPESIGRWFECAEFHTRRKAIDKGPVQDNLFYHLSMFVPAQDSPAAVHRSRDLCVRIVRVFPVDRSSFHPFPSPMLWAWPVEEEREESHPPSVLWQRPVNQREPLPFVRQFHFPGVLHQTG